MTIVFLLITAVSSVICLYYNSNMFYSYIAFLPIALFTFTFFGQNLFINLRQSYVYYLFYFQAIIRYCLVPIGISLGNFLGNGDISNNGNIAILYMIVELIAIFALFFYQDHKFKNTHKSNNVIFISKNYWLYFFVVLMLLIILFSGFLSKVNVIWNLNNYVQRVVIDKEAIESSSIGGLLFTPFKIATILIITSIILKGKSLKNSFKIVLLILLMGVSASFIVGTSRFSVVTFILPFYFLLISIFNTKTMKLINIGTVAIIFSVVLITSIAKFTRDDNIVAVDNILTTSSLNAYFSGVGNVATGIDAFESITEKQYGRFFLNDLFQNVPILSRQTNDTYKSNFIYNKQVYNHNLFQDQIVPLSIAGLFHFDIFGIGLYCFIFLSLSFYFERKGRMEEYLPYKYVFFSLMFSFSLVFMLNIGSMIAVLIKMFLFTYLLFYISYRFNNNRLV